MSTENLIKDVAAQSGVSEDDVRKVMNSLGIDRLMANIEREGIAPSKAKDLVIAAKIFDRVVAK